MPAEDKTKEFKFTVDDLVEATGLQKPSIRIGLRDSDFKKSGSIWGWNTQKEFDAVVKFFKERSGRRPDTTKKEPVAKADAKPTRKAKPVAEKADVADDKPRRRKAAA